MLPSSHELAIKGVAPEQGALLAEAFSDFIAASSRLELSYRDLQAEVAELSLALSERNRALSDSLSENRTLSERLQLILQTIPCGVVVVGEDGSMELANPEALRLLNLSTGNSAAPDLSPTPTLGLCLELQVSMMAEDTDAEQELLFEGSEGRIWVAVRRVALPADAATPPGRAEAVLTLRDISARKRMEEEREQARDAVALAQISALLAHEIRNPLASLELFAGLIEDSPERFHDWLSHLRAGIRSLSGTVNNVLTLHGNTPLSRELLDIANEGKLAVDFLQPLARQAEVTLRWITQGADTLQHHKVLGNRSAFHQILMNLCSNALRHTPAGGRVEVIYRPPPTPLAPLVVLVIDSGCGISAEHLPRLFEVGFSGTGSTCGLGLAVCDRLVRQLGGDLGVESRVGHGSTFTLELPQA